MPLVLAVDDDLVSRIVLIRMLRGLGCKVIAATTVAEALAVWDENRFDLIVSDYQLPLRTGLDLIPRATESSTPFILLTGIGGAGNLNDDRAGQVDAHLTKPVSSTDLAEVVNRLTGRTEIDAS